MLSGETDRAPGDYGFDPLNYKKQKVSLTLTLTLTLTRSTTRSRR